jgi:hypothetical protein
MKLLLAMVNEAENVFFGSTGSLGVTDILGKKVAKAATPPARVHNPRSAPKIHRRTGVFWGGSGTIFGCFFDLDRFDFLFDISRLALKLYNKNP